MTRSHLTVGSAAAAIILCLSYTGWSQTTGLKISVSSLELRSSANFNIRCELQPLREMYVRAPMSGFVKTVSVKLGNSIQASGALLQLDDRLQRIAVDRAAAEQQAAEAELAERKAASESTAKAEAAKKIADANKSEADYWLSKTRIISPWCEILTFQT